ncbi:MAG: hypothetical protein GF346_08240 [Candidatus Eisenbacteria bacterium]|nr:hypothetical protein [Candidatus Latescibacterota bacterium]MBD3302422.1 hypothetical protein [Candidatus Eisenbacteria bacterium]
MKRLLIIAFGVPPTRGPNPGRAWHFARHLPEHGWEAIVLTPKHPRRMVNIERSREHRDYSIPIRQVRDPSGASYWLQETRYEDVLFSMRRPRRQREGDPDLPGLYGKVSLEPDELALEPPPEPSTLFEKATYAIRARPDARAGWVRPGLLAARAVCRALEPDAVYSFSPPVSAHRIAMRVAENLKIPWIADLREPWPPGPFAAIDRMRILRRARAYQLPPSFDPADLPSGAMTDPRSHNPHVLVHAGPTEIQGRDAEPLLGALHHLIDSGTVGQDQIRVRLLGARDPRLTSGIGARFLSGVVTVEPEVPWLASLETQREAAGLLLALGPADRGRIPDRLLEAITVRRRVFAFGAKHEPLVKTLEETGIGRFYDDSSSLASGIVDWIRSGAGPPEISEETIAPYHAKKVVRGVVDLIRNSS